MYEKGIQERKRKVKKTLLTLGVCVLVLGLVGCGKTPTLKNGEKVIASVKGKKITAEDLYETLKSQGGQSTLVNMIDEFIVNKEVETDEDAETYAESQIESYKSSYKSYGQDFEEAITSAGYEDEDDFKDALIVEYKKNIVTEDFVKDSIEDSEIEKYYEDNIYGDIEAKHILISVDTDDDATDEEKEKAEKKAKKKAEKIIEKLNNGESFSKLAKKYSDDEGTASNGGKLTVTYGDVVDEFWEGVNSLEDKTYTKEPVKSEYGYHIIYRISQKDKPKLSEVKDDIIDKLVDEKMDEDDTLQTQAMVALRKKYNMSINDSSLKKAYNSAVKESLSSDDSDDSSSSK